MYADDTVILDRDPIVLHRNLDLIYEWCNKNSLTINCKRSQWMYTRLTGKKVAMDNRFGLGGELLSKVEEYKYLGIQIDSQLNFQCHRQTLINNVNYKLTLKKKKGNMLL